MTTEFESVCSNQKCDFDCSDSLTIIENSNLDTEKLFIRDVN